MIRNFIDKNGIIHSHDDYRLRHIESEIFGVRQDYYDSFIKEHEYIELFDDRKITNINGKSHTIVLENDTFVPEQMHTFASKISKYGSGKTGNIYQEFLGINKSSNKEGQIKYLLDYIKDNKIQNICIDSIFNDLEQFKLFCELCLNRVFDLNIFINSHSTLLNLLNTEFKTNKDVKFVINRNRIYDINFYTMIFNKISFDSLFKNEFINVNTFYFNNFKVIE